MDYNNLLQNKTALVTAGANGIGYAIAKKFEESGAKVFVCDINHDAVDMVNKNHQNIKAIFCDLSQTQNEFHFHNLGSLYFQYLEMYF